MSEAEGRKLVQACRQHLLRVMARMPECAAGGQGASNAELERAAGFALDLPEQDHWFTWSLLKSLSMDHRVEAVTRGPGQRRYYRLSDKERA